MTEQLTGLEFRRELGRGSMGQVVLARQLPAGRLVAVKRLAEASALSPVQQGRIRREAQALERLDHDHVVRLLELLQIGEEVLLVLEYIDGPSLTDLLEDRSLRPSDAMSVLNQVQCALQHAHGLGVLHRDVKPGNVLISREGVCKLTDFGLARLDDLAGNAVRTVLTRPGTPLGTAPYMAPEAVRGDAELDERSDLYSLAVVAYEVLVGRLPFPRDLGMLAILNAHLSRPVPEPTYLSPGFPPAVQAVLLRALEKDPKRRTPTVTAFWDALESAARDAWPGWQEQCNLAILVARQSAEREEQNPRTRTQAQRAQGQEAHASEPVEAFAEPDGVADYWFPGGGLSGLPRIEPTFPELRRTQRVTARYKWVLLAMSLALGLLLLVRTLHH